MLFWTFASALRLFNLWYIVDLLQRAAFAEHLTLLKYGAVPTSFLLCHEHRDALWVLKQWFVQLVLIRETLWWHVMTWWDIQPYFPHFQHLPSCPWEHCCQKGQELSSTLCSGSSTFLNFCSQGALVTLIEKMEMEFVGLPHSSNCLTGCHDRLWPAGIHLSRKTALYEYSVKMHEQNEQVHHSSSSISVSSDFWEVFRVWASNEWQRQRGSFPIGQCKCNDYDVLRT